MRKSFTQLSSLLVLLLLSVQMGFAQPELADNGLDPADGATVSSGITEFTLTFTGEVVPGTGGAIGLYDAADNLIRVFQVNGPNTVSAGGNATFADNTVTIEFSGVNYDENSAYYVSIEDKAIKDASGQNYVPADVFGSNEEWNFNIEDTSAPTLADEDALAPADDATDVGRDSTFRINFSEQVEFVDGYTPKLGDIALYTSTDMAPGQNQEGGDLLTLNGPYDVTLDGSGMFIDIEWFNYYSNLLPAYTEMYVRIKPDILQDMSGNKFAGINNNTGWNFSTKATATFDPAIKAYRGNEEQASGEIWTDVNFWIVFAEDIYTVDGTQVTSSNIADELGDDISLVDAGGNVVAATLSVVADSIRINPDNDLTSSSYTVNLNGNVIRYFDGSENNAASKTYASGDWTAPEITQFYADNFRGTSFDIFTKADEDCSIKYIVVKKGSSAPVLADIIGYADDGSNTTGTSREHRGTGTYTEQEGNLGDFYVIGTGESADTVEIFAEGTIPVNYPVESQRRVDGLPATQGPDNGEGEYEVYAVAYDASTTGLYDPDYFTDSGLSAAQQIQGNISGIEDTEAYTDDILMPSVWFDGDSATSGELLNADMLNPVELGVALADLHKKGTIYLNFNEDIRLANGAPITNTSISSFITVEDGLSQVGFEANYSADTKQIAIVADSSFKSATNVTVTIASSQIEDMAGNEFQPATAGLAIQDYTVELYNPVLAHFTPADAEVDFRENCITVKFNDIISAPAYLETVTGQEELLNNDPVSQLWVGRFFEITEGDINGASIGDQSVKGEFDFTVEYDEENDITTVTMCGDEFDWNSEAWYYVRAEERLMDSNRSLLDDGGGIIATSTPARTEEEPFSDITTDANDNLTISFQYGDTRSPEVVFFDPRTSD
nr:Ig-like domain-containing protein [Prolixibacteraceae bacterium]